MLTTFQSLLFLWLKCYLMLVSTYLFLGWGIIYFNRILGPDKKIQSRQTSQQAITRDFWQSIKSLITVSLMLAGGLYCQEMGLTLLPIKLTVFNTVPLLLLSMIVFDAWFYWGHRLIHAKFLYKWVHKWHHQSFTPTVWSNNSDTFLDNCFLQSYFLFAPFFLPLSGYILVAHKLYDQISGMIGHSGYEYSAGQLSRFPSPLIGVTFHDLHHEKFNYNYATHFSYWDRIMNTIHPDYDEKIKSFEQSSQNKILMDS